MKKLMVLMFAGLFLLSFAASAMAEVAINGSYRARLWYAGDYDMNSDNDTDDPATFIDNRLRLLLDVKVAEGIKVFANVDVTERRFGGAAGDANTQNMQVNEGYLQFAVPNTPLSLQVGRQDVTWYYGVLGAASDYRDRIKITANLKDLGLVVGASMDTTTESFSTALDDDDSTIYAAFAKYGIAGWDTGLIFVYIPNGIDDGATQNDSTAYLIGLGANGQAGPVKVGFEAATRFGTLKTRASGSTGDYNEVDLAGLGVLAIGSMPVGPVGLSLALAYATGDDTGTTDKNEGFTFDADGPVNGIIAWANNWAPEAAPFAGRYAADQGFSNGYLAKLSGTFAIQPVTLGLAAIYAAAVEDIGAVDAGPYGFEIDATCSYDIAPPVNLTVGIGYFAPGSMLKDLGYEDAAIGAMAKFEVKF